VSPRERENGGGAPRWQRGVLLMRPTFDACAHVAMAAGQSGRWRTARLQGQQSGRQKTVHDSLGGHSGVWCSAKERGGEREKRRGWGPTRRPYGVRGGGPGRRQYPDAVARVRRCSAHTSRNRQWRERAREPNGWASPRVGSACQRRKESEREEQVV
jgi:hypothetical protein